MVDLRAVGVRRDKCERETGGENIWSSVARSLLTKPSLLDVSKLKD